MSRMITRYLDHIVFKYRILLSSSSTMDPWITEEMLFIELKELVLLEKRIGVASFNYHSELMTHVNRLRKALFSFVEKEKCITGLTAILYNLASCSTSKELISIINQMYNNLVRDVGHSLIGTHGKLKNDSTKYDFQ